MVVLPEYLYLCIPAFLQDPFIKSLHKTTAYDIVISHGEKMNVYVVTEIAGENNRFLKVLGSLEEATKWCRSLVGESGDWEDIQPFGDRLFGMWSEDLNATIIVTTHFVFVA
jgi:hypothetical protein